MNFYTAYNFVRKIAIYVYAGVILESEGSIQHHAVVMTNVLLVFKLGNE